MGREIYDIINDMAEVLNASQMQKLQEVLVKLLFFYNMQKKKRILHLKRWQKK